MSDLLLNWLNDEVQLSKRITNFEEDFSNGFLFGELLNKYSQQLNFNEFVNKDDKAARTKNFQLLLETFNTLRVTFDANIAFNIIDRKVGVAKKVLYELKMQLEKTHANSFSKQFKSTKTLSPLKKIQISKQQYEKVSREHFAKQLNEMHPAQKTFLEQVKLRKFGEFHEKQTVVLKSEEEKMIEAKMMQQKKLRDVLRDNLKKSASFRNDWERTGIEKWKNNMGVRKDQQEKEGFYKSRIESARVNSKTQAEFNDLKSLENDISAFEKRFAKQEDSSEQENSRTGQVKVPVKTSTMTNMKKTGEIETHNAAPAQGFHYQTLQQELRKKKPGPTDEKSKHEREKRRRKMIVEQEKRYQLIQIGRRERYIFATIQQTSRQEKEIEYQIWRAWQNKQIIIQNKALAEAKQRDKQETREVNAKFKRDSLLKKFQDEHAEQLSLCQERQKKMASNHKVLKRKQLMNYCANLVLEIVGMSEKCYTFCQEANASQMDVHFVQHLVNEFAESAVAKKDVTDILVTDYLEGRREWEVATKQSHKFAANLPAYEVTLSKPINNYYLGNILRYVFEKLMKGQAPSSLPGIGMDLLVALLGLDRTGKKTIANHLAGRYDLHLITIEEMISKAIEQYIAANGSPAPQIKRIAELCLNGEQLDTPSLMMLLEQQLRQNPKSVLVNFPVTYDQALALVELVGGIKLSDTIQASKLTEKIVRFSRLAAPTPNKLLNRQIKHCGLDLVTWIDISTQISLDRKIGRRFVGDQVKHIKEVDSAQVYDLAVGERGSSSLLANNFKRDQAEKLKAWFNHFGFAEGDGFSCWQLIDGKPPLEQLIRHTEQVVAQIIKLKKQQEELKKQRQALQQKEEAAKQQAIKQKLELEQKCVLSTSQQIKKRFEQALAGTQLAVNFIEQATTLWDRVETIVLTSYDSVLWQMHDQQSRQRQYVYITFKRFVSTLQRQDQKFYLVKKFQLEYNTFLNINKNTLSQQHTKEELHQRVEDLENDLQQLVDDKREDVVQERNRIMSSGWLEGQINKFYGLIHSIIQTELYRYAASERILSDFYNKRYSAAVQIEEQQNFELAYDESVEAIKESELPRLDKLVADAIKLFKRQQEVVEDKNKKGGKGPPPPAKKDDKKQAKKPEVEQKAEPSAADLELLKALTVQKAIFRQRLSTIQAYAAAKLAQLNQRGKNLYESLEDFLLYSYRKESQSIAKLAAIFRKHIETETRIQHEVSIDYVDIYLNKSVHNFEKEKPIIKPATQIVRSSRFTITNLREILKVFSQEAYGSDQISSRKLMFLLESFIVNAVFKNMLPKQWQEKYVLADYERFIRKLDHGGYVSLSMLFFFLIMSDVSQPSQPQLTEFKQTITNYDSYSYVNEQTLCQTPAWFDTKQPCMEPNSRSFDRSRHLKSLLYSSFAGQSEQGLSVESFMQAIELKRIKRKTNSSNNIYGAIAFE